MQVLGRKFWAVPGLTQSGVEKVPQTRDTLSALGLMHIDLAPARDAVDNGHRGAFLWLLVSATQLIAIDREMARLTPPEVAGYHSAGRCGRPCLVPTTCRRQDER